jgi:hypothetical protein
MFAVAGSDYCSTNIHTTGGNGTIVGKLLKLSDISTLLDSVKNSSRLPYKKTGWNRWVCFVKEMGTNPFMTNILQS